MAAKAIQYPKSRKMNGFYNSYNKTNEMH